MRFKFLFLFCFSFSLFFSLSWAQNFSSLDPAEVETAFVYNFLKFVTWPDDGKEIFLLCVVGETHLLPHLLDLDGQSLDGKTLKVRKTSLDDSQLKECRAIFVGRLEETVRRKLFDKIDNHPILTISDEPGFVNHGGIVELFLEQGRFRFKINLSAARKVNLLINSRLLRLAEEVL